MKRTIRFFSLFLLAGVVSSVFLWICSVLLRSSVSRTVVQYPAEVVKEAVELRTRKFDPAHLPVVQQEVDYSAGPVASWYPKKEAPVLSKLVQEGKLPPVAERTGPEPLVLKGSDGIGNYGGTWFRLTVSPEDIPVVVAPRLTCATLVRWSPMGYPIRPHLAKGWDCSADKKVWTIYLRKGVRWSDGIPFTADDILYWWNTEPANVVKPRWLTTGGVTGRLEKIDLYTVRFTFSEPNGTFLENLASPSGFIYACKHYLEQYHPVHGNQELIRTAMAAANVSSPAALYNLVKDLRNPEHPRMWPWIYRTRKSAPPESFVRNPYYWAVDLEGNQLPYLDRILFEQKSQKLIALAAAAGEVTMQDRFISFDNYTMLMANREKYGYDVRHCFSAARSVWSLWPNGNRAITSDDPSSKWKAGLLADRRFRQALSLAVNRPEIIKAIYSGLGEPAQAAPGPESEFYNEKLLRSFTEHNPAKTNALLDELGLQHRDGEGMRTFEDGSRMTWFIDFTEFSGEGPAQFIVDSWSKVGIRAIQRERTRSVFDMERHALKHDFTVWGGESEFDPMVQPRSFVAISGESHFAPGDGLWYAKGGLYGTAAAPHLSKPAEGNPILAAQQVYEQALHATTRAEQIKLFQQILDLAAENVWSISVATPPPSLMVVQKGFRNVPQNMIQAYAYATPANAAPETFYFESPHDSPGALEQIERELTATTATPGSNTPVKSSAGKVGSRIGTLLFSGFFAGVILAGVRYPYIGRRLLVMIPTLLIISVITFFMIQLPPGDYIHTRIQELQMSGDESAIQEVEVLREDFHINDPVWKQYLRWMGFRWFFTFAATDQGLLQGELGRSMSLQRSVNEIVGDRVALTVLISLGTILFTWVVALPIGIYSAVRQYTTGDYLLTFVGLIGMCIPNFLLAILLMFLSGKYLGINITGLFSPEYAVAPEWSMGKVIDLLKHIWLPVMIIAASGTAGMVRIMRGNLLDELRKPYVTTAMAKGVRPFRLLMKYPVRLALNPFVSGIGHIFPQLISGGAIVAIVLSVPMVGPLLVDGLMKEDVYLAGSMLMVLSFLGMMGTLVSDLLLLLLDPRIRMEGKR